jgi:hypothetical protein
VAEHCLNQGAARAAVTVSERMDGLELSVRQRGMRENGQVVSVDEPHQVGDRFGDAIMMWRYEKRVVWPQIAAANPDLFCSPTTCVDRIGFDHQRPMHLAN